MDELKDVKEKMLLGVFSLFPQGEALENEGNVDINYDVLPELVKDELGDFLGTGFELVSLKEFTMILNFDEVQQVRDELAQAFIKKSKIVPTPKHLLSYELVVPSRHYVAIDINTLTKEAAQILVNALDDEFEGIASGGFHRLDDDDVTRWEQALNADLMDVNWFLELSTDAVAELKEAIR